MMTNRSTFFPTKPTNGRIDIMALTRYLSADQRSLIIANVERMKREQPQAIVQFANQLRTGAYKELLRLSNHELSCISLAALDADLIKESQLITLHLQIATLIEFYQFPHEHRGFIRHYDGFVGDITAEVQVQHYASPEWQDRLKVYFGMTPKEWDFFNLSMQTALESEQLFHLYKVPTFFENNVALREMQRLMSAFYFWRDNEDCFLFVPSYTMLQNRLAAFANFFNVHSFPQLQPLFGDVTAHDIEALKASGRVQFPLPCPMIAPLELGLMEMFYFKKFHRYSGCGPLSFVLHDYYHAWKEVHTKPAHRAAHFYIITLLREYLSKPDLHFRTIKYINLLINSIIDGDWIKATVTPAHPRHGIIDTNNHFAATLDYMLDNEVGVCTLWPEERERMEPVWQFIRERYQQYQQVNPGNDWRDNFEIEPTRDLMINKSRNSML